MREQIELLKDHADFGANLFDVADVIAKLDTIYDNNLNHARRRHPTMSRIYVPFHVLHLCKK